MLGSRDSEILRAPRRGNAHIIMKRRLYLTLFALVSALLCATSAAQNVVVEAVTTAPFGRKLVTAQARFGHTIGAGDVTVEFRILNNPLCEFPPTIGNPPENRIIEVVLLEDGRRVAAGGVDCFTSTGSLTYQPTVPGLKTLVVIGIARNRNESRSSGVPVEMYGISLRSSLGETVTTPFLPFTSRIFVEANALLVDANIKKAEFFHRNLPFALSSGVPYSVGDKVLSDGRLFVVEAIATSSTLPPGSERSLIGEADQARDTIAGITFRYVGPRLASQIDYFNYRQSTDPAVVIPSDYPASPRGRSDLVIGNDNGDVYEVVVAGRPTNVGSLTMETQDLNGTVEFECVGDQLINATYVKGDLVVSNGRIYEVIQEGSTGSIPAAGLTQTTGQVQTIGSVTFNFIPSKVFRHQLPYWAGDLLISNGRAYRVTVGGSLTVGEASAGLTAEKNGPRETRMAFVRFQRVGSAFASVRPNAYKTGDVVSSSNRIYKVVSVAPAPSGTTGPAPTATDPYATQTVIVQYETGNGATPFANQSVTFQLVVPQFHRYTQLSSDYAGVPLQEAVVYRVGDAVVSNGRIYEVTVGGTMGAVGSGLMTEGTETLGGLRFQYLSLAFKQLSTVRPFADVPFPYSAFDYSFPYALKWSPAESISNHLSLFGPFGYFEEHTVIELLTRTTDSKDRTDVSATVPVSILPPINPRASLVATITSPAPERLVAAGTEVQLTAEVKDENGIVRVVRLVQFFVDGVALYAPDVSFPYTSEEPAHWTPTIAGTYILNALAVDDKGNYTISPDLRVNVTDNQPFVRLNGPGSADPFNPTIVGSGTTIDITGVASGSGGNPARVSLIEVFSDGNLVGTAGAAADGTFTLPFTPTNASGAPLDFQLTARVTDVNGATGNSNVIYIQVSPSSAGGGGGGGGGTPVTVSTVQFAQPTYTAAASDSGVSITVSAIRAPGDNGPISVNYTTSNGSASSGQDYQTQTGTLVFGPGETQKVINVTLFPQTAVGPDRTFTITLSSPSKGVLGTNSTATVIISFPDLSTKVLNVATRGLVGLGDEVMIAGVIVQGSSPKRLVVRGVGPSLTQRGVPNAMSDPTLTLVDSDGNAIGYNDDHASSTSADRAFLSQQGLTPENTTEAAIVTTVNPGVYTAILRGKTVGAGLVEVYDVNQTASSRLVNISTRTKVGQGDNGALIAGFIIAPPANEPGTAKNVVIRAIGPSLSSTGVDGELTDTTLDLYSGSQLVFSNDNWKSNSSGERAFLEAIGLAPRNDKESVIMATLEPGSYSAVVRGKNNSTGVALVEVYVLNE